MFWKGQNAIAAQGLMEPHCPLALHFFGKENLIRLLTLSLDGLEEPRQLVPLVPDEGLQVRPEHPGSSHNRDDREKVHEDQV